MKTSKQTPGNTKPKIKAKKARIQQEQTEQKQLPQEPVTIIPTKHEQTLQIQEQAQPLQKQATVTPRENYRSNKTKLNHHKTKQQLHKWDKIK